MSDGIRGLVVAHSSLAAGLVSAVRQIAGVGADALQPLSNEGLGPDGLIAAVRERVGDAPVVLFTDMASGSCAFAARRISLERPRTGIVSGVNLPLLLDFVFHCDLPLPELVERLVEKGRGGITGTSTEEEAHADRSLPR